MTLVSANSGKDPTAALVDSDGIIIIGDKIPQAATPALLKRDLRSMMSYSGASGSSIVICSKLVRRVEHFAERHEKPALSWTKPPTTSRRMKENLIILIHLGSSLLLSRALL